MTTTTSPRRTSRSLIAIDPLNTGIRQGVPWPVAIPPPGGVRRTTERTPPARRGHSGERARQPLVAVCSRPRGDPDPLARRWAGAGQLRPTLDAGIAGDIRWVLSDPGLYSLFVKERGWSARFERWFREAFGGAAGLTGRAVVGTSTERSGLAPRVPNALSWDAAPDAEVAKSGLGDPTIRRSAMRDPTYRIRRSALGTRRSAR